MIITTKRTFRDGNTYIDCFVGARKGVTYRMYSPGDYNLVAHQEAARDCFKLLTEGGEAIGTADITCESHGLPDRCNHDYVHIVSVKEGVK